MSAIKLEKFGGMLPAWDPHLLPEGQSANSTNGYLFSGALEGWRTPDFLRNLNNPAAQAVYRIPTVSATPAQVWVIFKVIPANNDTITIDELTYTFVTTLNVNPAVPFQVLIGGSPLDAAANLLAAVTGDNGTYTNQGTLYSNGTTANGAVSIQGEVPGFNNSTGWVDIQGTAFVYTQFFSPATGAAYNQTGLSTTSAVILLLPNQYALTPQATTMTGGTNATFSNNLSGPSTWLEFVDPFTQVVRSQVVDDVYSRYYWSAPSAPPYYNTLARIQSGNAGANAPFRLGLNPPGCAPTLSVAGGGNNVQLGFTSSNQGAATVGANVVYLLPFVPSADLQMTDVQFMPNGTDPNVRLAAVLYGDLNPGGGVPTAPGALINTGTIITGITSGTLADSQFVNPSAVVKSTPYWMGIMMDTAETIQTGDAGFDMVAFPNTFTNGPPGEAPNVTTGQPDIYMYADFITTDVIEARAYAYTWVSAYGEESPPSPYTLANGWTNGTWSVGLYTPNPEDMGVVRNIAILRLYRTVTSVSGVATYYYVADFDVGSTNGDARAAILNDAGCNSPTAVYLDNSSDTVIALNLQLPSVNYFPPPESLQGIMALPNGLYVGFRANEIWFSEPYYPHAWPPGYTITTDFPVVGLGITLGALVACTAANAWVFVGTNPAQMSATKCAPPEPCTSRSSIVSADSGVYFVSPNGLIQVTNSASCANVTELWITREAWAKLVPLQDTVAIPMAGCFFCYGTTVNGNTTYAQQGFYIELNQDSTSFTIWPQPGGHRVGFSLLAAPNGFNVTNMQTDPWTSYGLVIQNGQVFSYNFLDPAPVMQPFQWTSKTYQQGSKKSYEAFKVFFTVPSTAPALADCRQELPVDNPLWQQLAANQWCTVLTYADVDDGNGDGSFMLVSAREVRRSGELLRIESGFKAENWYWVIRGRVVISNIQIATSAKELASV